ncbi:hypothetical protein [Chryseobacterium sp. OSA05B]|uniref:DUF7738 domain-containing protein n=1 Tax=Chryseobacterium sp. OSA05B TaxID=2862650 RepID=UPI001CBFCEAA|nr:hypothetical protein [Chryseobacterium sp. OSA05B]
MTTDFQFTECEAYYKGKPLPFGKPIEEWEKLFGKPTRKFDEATFIWDHLGLAIDNGNVTKDQPYDPSFEVRKHDKLLIFYSNLDSPAGQKGKLKFAFERESAAYLINEYKKGNPALLTKELEKKITDDRSIGGEMGADHFIYPYTAYKQTVTVDGAEIHAGMSLKELNKNRTAKDLEIFTFRDDNMNLVDETGTTNGDNGEYWNDNRKIECPKKQNYYFLNSVQYSGAELEYIKVGYRVQGDESPYF